MKLVFTIVLRHTHRILSPNQKVPLTVKGAIGVNKEKVGRKQKAKEAAYYTAIAQGISARTPRPNAYRIVWYFKGNRPDLDNLPTRAKAYLDGICQALKMDDGDFEEMTVRRIHDPKRGGTVSLEFGVI